MDDEATFVTTCRYGWQSAARRGRTALVTQQDGHARSSKAATNVAAATSRHGARCANLVPPIETAAGLSAAPAEPSSHAARARRGYGVPVVSPV